MVQSFLQKYGPSAIARGLWGKGPMPTRYVILFVGQGVIFTMALLIRSKDVEKAQHVKKLMEDEQQNRAESSGMGNNKSISKGGVEDRWWWLETRVQRTTLVTCERLHTTENYLFGSKVINTIHSIPSISNRIHQISFDYLPSTLVLELRLISILFVAPPSPPTSFHIVLPSSK